jgi:drug/metabolite transporter (DMT)-like permease
MGGKTAGFITIILAVVAAVGGVLFYVNHHTLRGLILAIAAAALLVLGIVFIATAGRAKTPAKK